MVSASLVLLAYSEQGQPTNDRICKVAISGATMTAGTALNIGTQRQTRYFGICAIGTKYAMWCIWQSTTSYLLHLLDISGAVPVSIASLNPTHGNNSGTTVGYSIVKVAPWTYIVDGGTPADSDYIVKLTPTAGRIGIMEAAGSSGATLQNLTLRFQTAILSGILFGQTYYVDDNAQPTTRASLTAVSIGALGVGINSTRLLMT